MQAFAFAGGKPLTDNELGRAAPDIHHQAFIIGSGQRMRHTEVNQPRFLAASDDFDGVAQGDFSLTNECGGIFGDPQRRGAHAPHGFGRQTTQPLAKTLQARQRNCLGGIIKLILVIESAGKAHGFLERIQRIKLIAGHSDHFQPEGVGPHVHGSQRIVAFHAAPPKKR